MRDDVMVIDADDAIWLVAALSLLEELVKRRGHPPVVSLDEKKQTLTAFLRRVDGRADTTMRPDSAALAHDSDIDVLLGTEEAAGVLGLSADAVRKACRSGRFAHLARRSGGRWWIPRSALAEVAA